MGAAICAALPFYAAFLAAFVTFGFAKAIFDPTMQAYIGDRVPYERRGRVMGITELSWSAAWLLGVPSAGWLIARVGWQAPFALLAVLGVAGLLLIAWLLPYDAPTVAHDHATFQLGAVIRNRNVMASFCAGFLIILANEVTFIVYGAWMESRFGLSVVSLGVASIVIGLAEAVGEFGSAAFVDRLGKRRAVLIGLAMLAITYGVLPMLGQRLEWAIGRAGAAVRRLRVYDRLTLAAHFRTRAGSAGHDHVGQRRGDDAGAHDRLGRRHGAICAMGAAGAERRRVGHRIGRGIRSAVVIRA